MKTALPIFDYVEPDSLNAVSDALLEGSILIAGGTDLVVAMREKELKPTRVVSLGRLAPSLNYIRFDDDISSLRLGALTTIHSIALSEFTKARLIALSEAASQMGNSQVRNVATIGGNICNGSPAADMAPPLIVLGSTAVLYSSSGDRVVPVEDIFTGPGKTLLKRGEILKEFLVPEPSGACGSSFFKVSRKKTGLSIVNAAAFTRLEDNTIAEVRIALGAVAPIPVRAKTVEKGLTGMAVDDSSLVEVCREVLNDIKPISDVRAGIRYRQRLAVILTNRAVRESIRRARSQ